MSVQRASSRTFGSGTTGSSRSFARNPVVLERKREARTVRVLARVLALHPKRGDIGLGLLVEREVVLALLEERLERELLRLSGLGRLRHDEDDEGGGESERRDGRSAWVA